MDYYASGRTLLRALLATTIGVVRKWQIGCEKQAVIGWTRSINIHCVQIFRIQERVNFKAQKRLHIFSGSVKILCYDTDMRLRSASRGQESRKLPESRSERNLAVAILRQAWHEAVMDLRSVKETSRNDYQLLKKKAIEWISTDESGFPYWCRLADVDHLAVRQRLCDSITEY